MAGLHLNYMKIINKILNGKTAIWFVLILASLLRIWNLNNIPPHLTPDEAALGYNAYSIIKTGKDEHGKWFPVIFKSFGDYKPGLYIYTVIPFVAALGLNEWSVRLPSAVFGIVIVYLLYLIIKKMFESGQSSSHQLAIFAALCAATNPWLITFSRGAWEVNLSLALTLLGIYYFLRSLDTTYYILHTAVIFALTLLAYQGAKLSTAIVVVLLVIIYWKKFWNISKKYLFTSLVLGSLISAPILTSMLSEQSGRLTVFSLFSYPRPEAYVQQMLDQGGEKIGDLNYLLFHNQTYDFLRGVLGRWFNHFSGRFLFFEGDFSNPRHSSPYQGMMLISDIALLSFGFVIVFKKLATNHKPLLFTVLWLLLSSLPAVLSRDQVHAVRALNMAIPLVIISAIGLNQIVKWSNGYTLKLLPIFGIWILSLIYFIDSYFIHLPKQNSKLWEYGYKQIVETVTPIQNDYKKVVVQQSFAQPYIYFLFFTKYDPSLWQEQRNYIESEYKYDVGYVTKIDNVYFEAIDWSRNRGDYGNLFVADTLRIPPLDSSDEKEFRLINEIKYLDNLNTAFRIIEVKNKSE